MPERKFLLFVSVLISVLLYASTVLFISYKLYQDIAQRYTDKVGITIDLAPPPAPKSAPKIPLLKKHVKKNKTISKVGEIKDLNKTIDKNITKIKPILKPDILKKVKKSDKNITKEKPVEKPVEIIKKSTNSTIVKKPIPNISSKLLNYANSDSINNEIQKETKEFNASQSRPKKPEEPNGGDSGIVDKYKAQVKNILTRIWNANYGKGNNGNVAVATLIFSSNGYLVEVYINNPSYDSNFNNKVQTYLNSLSSIPFPKPPWNNYNFKATINKDGVKIIQSNKEKQ